LDDVIKPSPGIVGNNNKKPEKKEDVIVEEDDEDDEDEEVLPGNGPIKGYAPPNVVKPQQNVPKPSTTVRIPIVARPAGVRPQWSPPPRIPTSTWIPSRQTSTTTTTTTTTTTGEKSREIGLWTNGGKLVSYRNGISLEKGLEGLQKSDSSGLKNF